MKGTQLVWRSSEDWRPIEISISRLIRLAKDQAAMQALVDGIKVHDDAFGAYLLGTEAMDIDCDEQLEAFNEAYLFTEYTQLRAYKALIKHLGLQRFVQAHQVVHPRGFPQVLLSWVGDADIWGPIEKQYELVRTVRGWCVFDTEPINRRLDC